MSNYKNIIPFLFQKLLSDKTRTTTEKIILNIALLSFFVHLLIIYLLKFNVIEFSSDTELLNNPISAIYTPFSFILIYVSNELFTAVDMEKKLNLCLNKFIKEYAKVAE